MEPLPLALTMGDPAGIGGECLAAAFVRGPLPPCFAVDDPARLAALGLPVHEIGAPEEARRAPTGRLPVIAEPLGAPAELGRPDPANAAPAIRSIERAVAFAREGHAGGVVTLPINKKALKDGAGFPYPGHTEFLAALTGATRAVMMIAAPGLRVVPVTIHEPLRAVPDLLSTGAIVETGLILAAALEAEFSVASPRIAVAGLNPHAGEGGAMGKEDAAVVAPAVAALKARGVAAFGPLPADTMFHPEARARYDAALCMYHDQALIPVKMLDFARGVNVTLGLPIVRTSPDHGTAYEIAGTGRADPTSLIESIRLAASMAAGRARTPVPAGR